MIKSSRVPSLDSVTENGKGKPDICESRMLAVSVVLWRVHEGSSLVSHSSEWRRIKPCLQAWK